MKNIFILLILTITFAVKGQDPVIKPFPLAKAQQNTVVKSDTTRFLQTKTQTKSDTTKLSNRINSLQSGKVPVTRTITINGVTQDLSANRTWTVSGGSGSSVFLSLATYGANGNNVADNASAIESACAAAMSGKRTLYIPNGIYRISRNLDISLTGPLKIICDPGARIVGNQVVINIQGGYSQAYTSASNITKGQSSLTIASLAAILAPDDIIEIESSDMWGIKPPNVTTYPKGELIKVRNVSGSTINLAEVTSDSYRSSATSFRKVNTHPLQIEGLVFDSVELNVYYARDVKVRDCKFLGFNQGSAMAFQWCHTGDISNNIVARDYQNGSYWSYGIDMGSCYDFRVTKNTVSFYDQAIVFTSSASYPSRRVVASENTLTSEALYRGALLDSHACVEFGSFERNIIKCAGIGIINKGSYVDLLNNTIELTADGATGIWQEREFSNDTANNQLNKSYNINIIGNKIFTSRPTILAGGITLAWIGAKDTIEYLNISDNYVDVGGTAIRFIDGEKSNYVNTCNINNNKFVSRVWSTFTRTDTMTINQLNIFNTTFESHGSGVISFDQGTKLNKMYVHNSEFNNNGQAVLGVIRGVQTQADIEFRNTTFKYGYIYYDNLKNVSFYDCKFLNMLGDPMSIGSNVTNSTIFRPNISIPYDASYLASNTKVNFELPGRAQFLPTGSGTLNLDLNTLKVARITPTGNLTINASGGVIGATVTITGATSGTSSYNVTFGTNFISQGVFATGTQDGKYFTITFLCVDGTYWREISRITGM